MIGEPGFAPRAFASLLLLFVMASPRIVRADGSPDQAAAAEALFDQARELMKQGDFARACAKFAESQRLDAGVGTLIYLADCYEKSERLASAWVTFREAAAAARAAGQTDRETLARDRATTLEPKLTKLVIDVVATRPDGLEIHRDDTVVSDAMWGTEVPVDAGEYTIRASAPGRNTWTRQVVVSASTPLVRVEVPALEPSEEPVAQSAPVAPRVRRAPVDSRPSREAPNVGRTQRIAGYVTAGVGVGGMVVGAYFWQRGRTKHDDALDHCTPRCNDDARALQDDAERSTTVGNVAVIGGAVLAAGGVFLVLASPRAKPPRAGQPRITRARAALSSVTLGGEW